MKNLNESTNDAETSNSNEEIIFVKYETLQSNVAELIKKAFRSDFWGGWYYDLLLNKQTNTFYISEARSGGIIYDNSLESIYSCEQFYKDDDGAENEEYNYSAFFENELDEQVEFVVNEISEKINDNEYSVKIKLTY